MLNGGRFRTLRLLAWQHWYFKCFPHIPNEQTADSLKDNDYEAVAPQYMLVELCEDNQHLTESLRSPHKLCDKHSDVATASLIETWIDETERRVWFLSEI
jgi:starvation-inducible DNA-binding protein